jgi:hypothetical protein
MKLLLILMTAALAGCVIHGQRNAPGIVKVEQPPHPNRVACNEPEIPDDPGERVFTVSTGLGFAGGAGISRSDDLVGLYVLNAEMSLHYGVRNRSHYDDRGLIPFVNPNHWPHHSLALNLGWHVLQREADGPGVGAGYAELQVYSLKLMATGVAAGWAYDLEEERHGPQITLFTLGTFFVRVTHLLDRGTDLLFGMQFKVPISFMWSK